MLYIAATPIGNLDDITQRVRDTLARCEIVACEDTRRTGLLFARLGIKRPRTYVSYRQENEHRLAVRLADRLERDGIDIALCSDGGLPGISDPGYRLITEVITRGMEFTVLPGASAVTTALLLAGLPCASFTFKGFPPRKSGPLRRFFEEDITARHTLVLYESPYRTARTLAAALEVLGNRHAAVCMEMTKKFERVARGPLEELAARFADEKIKGEVTIVIEGRRRDDDQ